MVEYRRITPVDVLFLRGNRLFGGPGDHGEAQMPPWPSVFTGAVASYSLAESGLLGAGDPIKNIEERLGEDYALTFLGIEQGGKLLLPMPADLVASEDDSGEVRLERVEPAETGGAAELLYSSYPLPRLAVLRAPVRRKPRSGLWLSLDGWREHLEGATPGSDSVVDYRELWKIYSRLGIALDRGRRTTQQGKLYTSDAVAFDIDKYTAFLCGFSGTNIPQRALLRLGGDGRGADMEPANDVAGDMGRPRGGWSRFRMIFTTPCISPVGWLPPGVSEKDGRYVLSFDGVEAELVAAATGKSKVVSGWDLKERKPKSARQVISTGAGYWFEMRRGDTIALERLWKNGVYDALMKEGASAEWQSRKREGFGRVWFGTW